ncbi:MAG: DEAD/DEAH box helicase, partial [Bacteroidetes bacterium]|nr:DEAD/DEAH box helicase [Bacteroidota bacterium]
MSFDKLGLSAPALRAVQTAGYTTPTEIQTQAIPPALSGTDVIGRAKTGSGKTAAFILPIIDRLEGGRRPGRGIIRALVLTPTRELAQQVADSAKTYSRYTKLSSDAFYGGVSIEPQFKRLGKGIDILAATPGRLLDHIERGTVDLSQCEVLIVDEADRMFDMGFIKDVHRIISRIPKNRQTMLFSATMSAEVRLLTADIMRDPVYVEVGVEGNPAESVQQWFYSVPKQSKLDLLFHLLKNRDLDSVLVFSRTKHGANKIAKRLERSGIKTGVLHSNKSQSQRLSALAGFREGRHRVLVATDIAARGIDVVGISHVINYDTPAFAEDYLHRIGRTGRAEATGDAITFVAGDEKDYLRKIERFVGRRFSVERMPEGVTVEAAVEEVIAAAPQQRQHNGRNGHRRNGESRGERRNGEFGTERKNGDFRSERKSGEFRSDRKNGEPRGERKNGDFRSEHRSGEPRGERKNGDFRSEHRSGEPRGERKNGDFRSEHRSGEPRGERKSGEFRGERKSGEFRGERKSGEFRGE